MRIKLLEIFGFTTATPRDQLVGTIYQNYFVREGHDRKSVHAAITELSQKHSNDPATGRFLEEIMDITEDPDLIEPIALKAPEGSALKNKAVEFFKNLTSRDPSTVKGFAGKRKIDIPLSLSAHAICLRKNSKKDSPLQGIADALDYKAQELNTQDTDSTEFYDMQEDHWKKRSCPAYLSQNIQNIFDPKDLGPTTDIDLDQMLDNQAEIYAKYKTKPNFEERIEGAKKLAQENIQAALDTFGQEMSQSFSKNTPAQRQQAFKLWRALVIHSTKEHGLKIADDALRYATSEHVRHDDTFSEAKKFRNQLLYPSMDLETVMQHINAVPKTAPRAKPQAAKTAL